MGLVQKGHKYAIKLVWAFFDISHCGAQMCTNLWRLYPASLAAEERGGGVLGHGGQSWEQVMESGRQGWDPADMPDPNPIPQAV